jgi:hypothetical protein
MTGLDDWLGTWAGSWATYLRPGELYDTSDLTITIERSDEGFALTYRGSIAEDPVQGTMVVATGDVVSSIVWTDSWHTEGQTEQLTASEGGHPSYTYGPDDEPWTWSISIDPGDTSLTITHFNAPPDGEAAPAVLARFDR